MKGGPPLSDRSKGEVGTCLEEVKDEVATCSKGMLTCGTAFGLSRTRKGAWMLTDVTDELMQLVHKDFSKRMPEFFAPISSAPPTSST